MARRKKRLPKKVEGFERLARWIEDWVTEIPSGVHEDVVKRLKEFGIEWRTTMRKRTSSTGAFTGVHSSPTAPPKARTGFLSRRFHAEVKGDRLDTAEARLFNTAGIRAWVQEWGTKGRASDSPIADIRPKNKQFLTIPLEDALTKSGTPREGRNSIRDWPEGFFLRTGDANRLFFVQEGPGGQLEFLYRLTKGPIKLYPRLGMRKQYDKQTPKFIEDVLKILGDNAKPR